MDDPGRQHPFEKTDKAVSALFYIMNKEMAKPENEMNTGLIDKCADAIPRIDAKFSVPEEKTDAFAAEIIADHKEKQKNTAKETKKKLSNRLKVIIAAAVTLIILGGIAVSSRMDILLIPIFEKWKDGEKRTFGNIDLEYNEDSEIYESFEKLISDKNLDILYPKDLSARYSMNELVYSNKANGIKIETSFMYDDEHTVFMTIENSINRDKYILNNMRTEIINGHKYYFVSEESYQAAALINDYVYVFSCNTSEEAIRELIEKTR